MLVMVALSAETTDNVVNIYESRIIGSNGELVFAADAFFYLPPEKVPNAHYLVNFSLQTTKELMEFLTGVTCGFKADKI